MIAAARRIALAIGCIALAWSLVRAEIIDRILAVVDNSIITQSDVLASARLGLEKAPASGDPIAVVLERLIERRLTLAEVDRYAPPEPSAADLTLRLEQVRLAFPSAAAFETAMAQVGLDEEQLRRRLRDDLRIDAYLQQRFGSVLQPPEDQILEYYRAHQDEFTKRGTLRPFNDAHDDARDGLIVERRKALILEWVTSLRRRANISVLYVPR